MTTETDDEYPIYFYASRKYILWELFCIFWVPALGYLFAILSFLPVLGNERHVEGAYALLWVSTLLTLGWGAFTRAQRYWFQWHHEGPIIKLDRNEVTFFEYCDKPIPHEEFHHPFQYFHDLANFMGHAAVFKGPRSRLVELGYPKPGLSLGQIMTFRNGGAIRVKMPFRGGQPAFLEEYYKLHPKVGGLIEGWW